jgi:serine/threonine protein kinase
MAWNPKANDIFLKALEITPAERRPFLDQLCGQDGELRSQVEGLLSANERAGTFLEKPAFEAAVDLPPGATVGMEGSASPTPEYLGATQTETLAPDGVPSLDFLAPSSTPQSLGRLDHYDIRELVGKGGMGVVLKAFDEKLHRVVAVKVMTGEPAASATARKRFIREAQAAAAVCHEHVVTIHAVEEAHVPPYLVMQFVAGLSLQQKLEQEGPLDAREVLRIGMQMAEGLAAAHKQGLIHRDVKPANVLLENGVERVKITDFGLARAADDASLTQSGVIAGTPMYMSPEQADGQHLDHRSDLFSLGSVLYAMCTGRPPFRASGTLAVLKRVCEEIPRPIRELNPEIPEEVCRIIGKLLAKKPDERYQSAQEVAELLGRQLARLQQPAPAGMNLQGTDEPVPQTMADSPKLLLESRLQPAEAGTPTRMRPMVLGILGCLAIAGLVFGFLFWRNPAEQDRGGDPNPPNRDGAPKVANPLNRHQHNEIPVSLLAQAGGGDPEQAPPELVALLGDSRFRLPTGRTSWMAQSSDGKLLAVPCGSGVVLFDPMDGRTIRVLTGHNGIVYTVAFHPEGKLLAAGNWDGDHTVKTWDLATGKIVQTFKGHQGFICGVGFSRDGRRLLSASADGTAKVWDVDNGKEVFTLRGHQDWVRCLCHSPDGKRLLSISNDKTIKVWDAEKGTELKTLGGHTETVLSLAYSPDGQWLATGSEKELKIWNAKDLSEVHSVSTAAGWLTFTPDGKNLLTATHQPVSGQRPVARWETATGKALPPISIPLAGTGSVYQLRHDGKVLFAVSIEQPLRRLQAFALERPGLPARRTLAGDRLYQRRGRAILAYCSGRLARPRHRTGALRGTRRFGGLHPGWPSPGNRQRQRHRGDLESPATAPALSPRPGPKAT